jgi:Cu-processing system permease protein
MRAIAILAGKEIRDGIRNRWVAAAILLLTSLALVISLLGSAPTGTVKASALAVTVASLSSLTVYLLPLIALMLAYDALVGEFERGTMLLLLSYPVARWQVVLGKFLGHMAILLAAILIGYGGVGLLVEFTGGGDPESRLAYFAMMVNSALLGAAFIGLGYLVSVLASERATAAGLAVALWLGLVVLYDLALLGLLLADQNQVMGEGLFAALMAVNPTDAYRLVTLSGTETVRMAAGLADGVTGAGIAVAFASIAAWVIVPLGVTVFLFQRRDL